MMELLRKRAYARAGLIGNPSDGYHGKTISVIVRNYYAEVVLYAWEDMELIPSQEDNSRFGSIHELVHDVELHGYYGGLRLVKATIKKFVEFVETGSHYMTVIFRSAMSQIYHGRLAWPVPVRLSWQRCEP